MKKKVGEDGEKQSGSRRTLVVVDSLKVSRQFLSFRESRAALCQILWKLVAMADAGIAILCLDVEAVFAHRSHRKLDELEFANTVVTVIYGTQPRTKSVQFCPPLAEKVLRVNSPALLIFADGDWKDENSVGSGTTDTPQSLSCLLKQHRLLPAETVYAVHSS